MTQLFDETFDLNDEFYKGNWIPSLDRNLMIYSMDGISARCFTTQYHFPNQIIYRTIHTSRFQWSYSIELGKPVHQSLIVDDFPDEILKYHKYNTPSVSQNTRRIPNQKFFLSMNIRQVLDTIIENKDKQEQTRKELEDMKVEKEDFLECVARLERQVSELQELNLIQQRERHEAVQDRLRLEESCNQMREDLKKSEERCNQMREDLKKSEESCNQMREDLKKSQQHSDNIQYDLRRTEKRSEDILENLRRTEKRLDRVLEDLKKTEDVKSWYKNKYYEIRDKYDTHRNSSSHSTHYNK